MPEDTPVSNDDTGDRVASLIARVGELELERDRLRAEVDALTNRALEHWLTIERRESAAVDALHQTLSWRVTKPLRVVRSAQLARSKRAPGGLR